MEASMTITQFTSFLNEQSENPLLTVLRQITRVEAPEKVRELKATGIQIIWVGWCF